MIRYTQCAFGRQQPDLGRHLETFHFDECRQASMTTEADSDDDHAGKKDEGMLHRHLGAQNWRIRDHQWEDGSWPQPGVPRYCHRMREGAQLDSARRPQCSENDRSPRLCLATQEHLPAVLVLRAVRPNIEKQLRAASSDAQQVTNAALWQKVAI